MTNSKPATRTRIESTTIMIAYQVKGKPTTMRIKADVIGPLAVHPTMNEDGFWTVTHVETGHAIYRFVSSNLEAMSIAKKLAAHVGWSGSREEIEANKNLKRDVGAVLNVHGIMVTT